MNVKTKIIVLFFTAMMIVFYSCCNFAQNNLSEDQQMRDMLKEFYTSYMTQFAKWPPDSKKEDSIRRKYCTTRLLKDIKNDEELDYDPWLSGQDADVENLKTLSIKKNMAVSNEYVVTYEDAAKNKLSITLVVVKEKDGYKIDSVQSEGGKKYGGGK